MTTQKTLATFRCDLDLWNAFLKKVQAENISATKKLIQLVSDYLGVGAGSPSPIPEDLVQRLERLEALFSQSPTGEWLVGDAAFYRARELGYEKSRAAFYRQLKTPDIFEFIGLECDLGRREKGQPWIRFTGGPVFTRKLQRANANRPGGGSHVLSA